MSRRDLRDEMNERESAEGDALGDRMKDYERAARQHLPRRMPVIVRLDGKAFHTLTAHCERPFDKRVMTAMDCAAEAVAREAQGAVLAYVQSDEISLLLFNYRTMKTEAWFDNGLQKIVSVAASVASVAFTDAFERVGHFDARAFVLPEAEVNNYFVWRQRDWQRNSLQMLARASFSQKQLHGKGHAEMHCCTGSVSTGRTCRRRFGAGDASSESASRVRSWSATIGS